MSSSDRLSSDGVGPCPNVQRLTSYLLAFLLSFNPFSGKLLSPWSESQFQWGCYRVCSKDVVRVG